MPGNFRQTIRMPPKPGACAEPEPEKGNCACPIVSLTWTDGSVTTANPGGEGNYIDIPFVGQCDPAAIDDITFDVVSDGDAFMGVWNIDASGKITGNLRTTPYTYSAMLLAIFDGSSPDGPCAMGLYMLGGAA